jgi:hypothetical protein
MTPTDFALADVIGTVVGFFLTLLVFSYLLGDNPLFRLAVHLFIGVAAGYAAIITLYNVLLPRLVLPLLSGETEQRILALVLLLLSVLLLTKVSPYLAGIGSLPMAFLVGVGAAVAINGAMRGTLLPQTLASINLFDLRLAADSGESPWMRLINGSIILVGTLSTLATFHFGARPRRSTSAKGEPAAAPQRTFWIEVIAALGQVFIAITFGVLLAGVYSASLSALIERLYFLFNFIKPLLIPLSSSL